MADFIKDLEVENLEVENLTVSGPVALTDDLSDLSISGDMTVGDDLVVTDDASVGGDLTVTGNVSGVDLAASGDITAGDDLVVTDDITVGGSTTKTPGGSTAAAGDATGNATVLPAATASTYPVTGADDAKGVRLHANDEVTGREIKIANLVSNKILKVYPPTGGTINGAAADAAFSSASGKGVIVQCINATTHAWAAW